MEPNKLEKEFRSKLGEREINPSPAAWDRLDAMLTIAEEKKPAKKYSWLFIAAAIVSFLMISGIVFFQKDQIDSPTEIVLEEKVRVDEPSKPLQFNEAVSTQVVVADSREQKSAKNKYTEPQRVSNSNATPIQSVSNQIGPEEVSPIPTEISDELIAEVASSQPRRVNTTPVKVDASQLLSEVDDELELSFREKVIKSAGKNFQNVKVALANRNLE